MTVLESEENIHLMSNSTAIDLDLLHPYYTYRIVISAVTIGPGPLSSAYNVTTDEEGNPFYLLGKLSEMQIVHFIIIANNNLMYHNCLESKTGS